MRAFKGSFDLIVTRIRSFTYEFMQVDVYGIQAGWFRALFSGFKDYF